MVGRQPTPSTDRRDNQAHCSDRFKILEEDFEGNSRCKPSNLYPSDPDQDPQSPNKLGKYVSNAAFAHAPVCSKTLARMQE